MSAVVERSVLFDALKLLTTPPPDSKRDSSSSSVINPWITADTEGPKGEDFDYKILEFDKLLLINLEFFEKRIITDEQFAQLLEDLHRSLGLLEENDACNSTWKFVRYCTSLLRSLAENCLTAIANRPTDKSPTVGGNQSKTKVQSAPPDILSVSEQKTVLAAVQFIVCLGFAPCLQPGVGIPIELRSELGRIVSITTETNLLPEQKEYRLLFCLQALLMCIKVPSLGAIILSRHLTDILAVLMQLCNSPKKRVASKGHNPTHNSPLSAEECNNPASVVDAVISRNSNKDICQKVEKINNGCTKCETLPNLNSSEIEKRTCVKSRADDVSNSTGEVASGNFEDSSGESSTVKEDDRKWCQAELDHLVDRVYQPVLVRELLLLQGGASPQMLKKIHDQTRNKSVNTKPKLPALARAPQWLRKVCGLLLTQVLLKPHGVQYVLRGMMDMQAGSGNDLDWRKCEAVAKVIANCPQKMSKENYYEHISEQVLELLHFPDRQLSRQFCRVGCHVIYLVSSQHPELADQFFMGPLIEPLRVLTKTDVDTWADGAVVVGEEMLSQCIEDLHKVLVAGVEPPVRLFYSVRSLLQPLFILYCYLKQGVSLLKSAVKEILVTTLKAFETTDGVISLKSILFDEGEVISPYLSFSSGPSGGVQVFRRRISNDDDDFETVPQKARTSGLVELLKHLQTNGLAGEFFLFLLKELSSIIQEGWIQDSLANQSNKLNGLANENMGFKRQFLILNLLAEISETLGPSCLKSAKHVLEFAEVTLKRAVEVYSLTTEVETGLFENETITMAMGLLTAILSGAVQATADDKKRLTELSPLLLRLEENHPDDSVKEMASDLRVAIATHGAVWSTLLGTSCGKKVEGHRSKPTNETMKQRPKIEVLSESKTDMNNSQVEHKSTQSELSQAFEEVQDRLIPVRGHGLIMLRNLLEAKDPASLEHKDAILNIFQENLTHSDSYLYLSAVNGLVAMATLTPDNVIQSLTDQFANFNQSERSKSVELRLKLGECLVKACRNLGDMLSPYRDILMASILSGAKDPAPEIRASSLSNLGEVCKLLRFSLGTNIHEVFSCCSNLLRADPDTEVRKAAGLVLTMLLQGLGQHAFTVLESVLRDLYRLLKLCQAAEKDDGVLLHINLAFRELDVIMREYLFPKQTLTKTIQVSRLQ